MNKNKKKTSSNSNKLVKQGLLGFVLTAFVALGSFLFTHPAETQSWIKFVCPSIGAKETPAVTVTQSANPTIINNVIPLASSRVATSSSDQSDVSSKAVRRADYMTPLSDQDSQRLTIQISGRNIGGSGGEGAQPGNGGKAVHVKRGDVLLSKSKKTSQTGISETTIKIDGENIGGAGGNAAKPGTGGLMNGSSGKGGDGGDAVLIE
ncbi:MAG: hypothetical protein K2Y22_03095 [Candidatus Obscuribacterales bacterium]|nr:hypothetical protein [Candidatus Obscuribacterales bacterium]